MSSTGAFSAETSRVALFGTDLDIEIRINPRARRILLRTDTARSCVVLVLPSAGLKDDGLRFAARKAGWLKARLSEVRDRTPFAEEMTLPVLGRQFTVELLPTARDPIQIAGDRIVVGGTAAQLPRRLSGWLQSEARRQLGTRSRALATKVGRRVSRVTVRDTKSRWGSCSTGGALSFSWRLILAPEVVLDYVVAHEVAHLRVPDHSPRFWSLVAELHPSFAAERRWLKQHGAALHRYGTENF